MFNENFPEICFSFGTIKILTDKSEDKKKRMEEKKKKSHVNSLAEKLII
ncbi:hypothetical protein H6B11_04815 [Mediterraneibacter glycyrrhizinilyticus]|nr:hypothetical protein [Mediterraneibacter glycyrrhizinilyticus]MBM6853488.1 hypothetical protein [Mediterraneibacter glycyrrhizinilyticus]